MFVIDSTDLERLETAAGELRAMLQEEELRDAALLVFANKQDQPGAKGAGEISEALKLAELKDRNWSIMACSAIDGRGVNEGMDWLVVSIPCSRRGGFEGVLTMGCSKLLGSHSEILCFAAFAWWCCVYWCLGIDLCITPYSPSHRSRGHSAPASLSRARRRTR